MLTLTRCCWECIVIELFSFCLFSHIESFIMRIEKFHFRFGIIELIFGSDGFVDFLVLEESTFLISKVDNSLYNSEIFKDIIKCFMVVK